jgi:hypothetical protein
MKFRAGHQKNSRVFYARVRAWCERLKSGSDTQFWHINLHLFLAQLTYNPLIPAISAYHTRVLHAVSLQDSLNKNLLITPHLL